MIDLKYQDLLHDVAVRLSALIGSSVINANLTYDSPILTSTSFKSIDWPFGSFRDSIIMAVADISWAIADTGGHPWRASMGSTTGPRAQGTTLPILAINNREIIGVWGTVFDATDNTILTEQPLEVIRRLNQETWRTYPLYYFKIDGGRIEHTREFVNIECCIYSQADQLSIWNSTGLVSLPGVLRPVIVARALSLMTKDGAWAEQARTYSDYADTALARIRAGFTTLPSKTLPGPTPEGVR